MTELFEVVESSSWRKRLPWILAAVIVVAGLVTWYFTRYGGNTAVNSKLDALNGAARTSQRRADAVLDAVTGREATARAEVRKKINSLPDDAIVSILSDLLRESRAER